MMSDKPLVSVITPSFNQSKFLEETIQSVLNQDYPSVEYIIIDGGSTDGSVDIIKKYEQRLKYWVSEKDRGQTHAINKGFAKAEGSFMTWLCSDDLLEPSMVSISVHHLLNDPEIGMTFGDQIRLDRKGNIYSTRRFPSFKMYYLKLGFSIPQETVLFRRDVFEKVGGLDESLHMVMDFDLWCKISSVSRVLHIPAYLGRFRVHSSSKSYIFSNQLDRKGFDEGWPKEYSMVYKSHFGKNPSQIKQNFIKMFMNINAFFERRTRNYKKERDLIDIIRLE